MQHSPSNLVPIYQNGVLTWVPASQNMQNPNLAQQTMVPQQMIQRQMMDTVSFQNRAMAMSHGMVPNVTFVSPTQPIPGPMVSQQAMMKGRQVMGRAGPYVQGITAVLGSSLPYGTQMQQHDGGGDTMDNAYSMTNYVVGDPAVKNVGAIGTPVVIRNTGGSQIYNAMDNVAGSHPSQGIIATPDAMHNFAASGRIMEHNMARSAAPQNVAGVMAHNQRNPANMSASYMHAAQNAINLLASQEMKHAMDTKAGHQVPVQRMYPMNQFVGHQSPRGMPTAGHNVAVTPVGYPRAQPMGVGPTHMTNHAQVYLPVNAKVPKANQMPVQLQQNLRGSNMVNESNDMVRRESLAGQMPLNSGSQVNMYMQQVAAMQKPSRAVTPKRPHKPQPSQGKRTNEVDEALIQPNKILFSQDGPVPRSLLKPALTMQTIFAINKKWKFKSPDQMVYFDLGISLTGYCELLDFMRNLHEANATRDEKVRGASQAINKNGQQAPNVSQENISDDHLMSMINNLKNINSTILNSVDKRKMVQWSYPGKNCVVFSDFNTYELQCFFATTSIGKGVNLSLYHSVTCDECPEYIFGKESRKYKVVVERKYEMLLPSQKYNIEIKLRRITDEHEKSFQVTFGVKVHDLIDLITHVLSLVVVTR